MAKSLRDVTPKAPKKGEFTGVNKSKTEPADISDFVPDSASGNRDFAKKHKIEKHEYPYGDEAFTSGKVKGAPYKKQDQKVYESMKCESCGKSYEGESCGCGSKVPQAGDGKRGMLADKKKLNEILTKKTPVGKVISDFVKSDAPTFSRDSKKQRIKRALGAYYSMHKEESLDEVSTGLAHRAAIKAWTKSDLMKSDAKKDPDIQSAANTMLKASKKNQQGNKFIRYAQGMKEDLAIPMLEGGKKKTRKESAPGETPMRFPSGDVGDTGRV